MKFIENLNRFKTFITFILHFIFIIQTLLSPTSALSVADICEYVTGQQIYCNCDNQGVDEARQVTCFILEAEGLSRSSHVWNGFKLQKNITSLMITTRFERKLTFLPVSALKNFAESLETLEINEMKLNNLEMNSMNGFYKLFKISFESNEIRSLSESTFANLPALKTLSLSSNSIEVLKAGVFVDLPKLEEIFIDRNKLKTIEDNAFSALKSVKELDLRLNVINGITSATFSGLSGLKRLDLSRNQLKTIPNNGFIGAPLLRELDLSKNQINTIEENAFQNLSHLMSIQLNQNSLKYLSAQVFKSNPNLALIDLSDNFLQTIERPLISGLQHITSEQFVFYIRDNRLECDCRLLWLSNTTHTFGQLFRRELKLMKCNLIQDLGDFKSGDETKLLTFVMNQTVINICLPNSGLTSENIAETKDYDISAETSVETSVETEDTLNLYKKKVLKESEVLVEKDVFKEREKTINESTINNNKIDSETNDYFEVKSHSSESESITESVSQTEKVINNSNDRQNTGLDSIENNLVKASRERTDPKDGSLSNFEVNNKTIVILILISYLFHKII